jgi:O-antigen ligase
MMFVVPILVSVLAGVALLAFGAAPYALLAALATPIVYLALKRPMLLCAIAVASQAWNIISVGILTLFKGLMLVMVMQMVLVRRRSEPWPRLDGRFALLAGILIGWCCLRELASTQTDLGFLFETVGCIVMYASLTHLVRTEDDLRTLMKVSAVNSILVGLWVVHELPWSAMTGNLVRAAGPIGQPNGLGQFAAAAAPFALALMFDDKLSTWWRLTSLVSFPFTVYTLFGSASRNGFVSFLVATTLMVLGILASTRASRVLVAVVVAFIATSFVFAPKSVEERVFRAARVLSEEPSGARTTARRQEFTSGRDEFARFGIEMLAERPMEGWGVRGFQVRWQRSTGTYTALHSAFISVAVAYGFPAGALYATIVLLALSAGVRATLRWSGNRLYPLAVVAGALASVLNLTVSTNMFRFWDWAPLLLGLVLWRHRARFVTSPRLPEAVTHQRAATMSAAGIAPHFPGR